MAEKESEMDSYVDEIVEYMEELSEQDQLIFASRLISGVCMAGKMSHIERLGVLECARVDVVNNVINPDIEDEYDRLTSNN